jgi:hypothetical protein
MPEVSNIILPVPISNPVVMVNETCPVELALTATDLAAAELIWTGPSVFKFTFTFPED